MFRNGVLRTCDVQLQQSKAPNSKDFLKFLAETNQDDYIFFSGPSKRSSYLQTNCFFAYDFNAKLPHRRGTFAFDS